MISVSKNELLKAKLIKQAEQSKIQTVDSSKIIDAAAEQLTSMYFLDRDHPTFTQLSLEEKQQIMNNVRDSLSSVSFRTTYPNNPMIIYELATMPRLIAIDSLVVVERWSISNISSGEFWFCTTSLGLAAIGDYGQILKDFKWLLQNGAGAWGAVFDLAWGVVKNSVPWWKVVALAGSYATCLYGAGNS